MNEQQLARIEERWAAASGGPWIVEDWTRKPTDRGLVMTTKEALDRFAEGKTTHLENAFIRTERDAIASGLVRDRDEWVRLLEEKLVMVSYDQLAQSCRLVLPCTRSRRDSEEREQNRTLLGKEQRLPDTPPVFAILGYEQDGNCTDANLRFVLHAPEDMGVLIEEVKRQEEVIESLKEQLLEARESLRVEKERTAQVNASISGMREMAKKLLALQEGPG